VLISNGRIKLCTDNATYSYEDLYTVFNKGFNQLNIQQYQFDKVLILGFGLGSVPSIFHKKYDMQSKYTGIEIDSAIVALNQEYLSKDILSQCNIIEADAYDWVQNTDEKFNLIIIDLFIDTITDSKFREELFVEATKKLLAEKGILLFNMLADSKEKSTSILKYYNSIFKNTFKNSEMLKLGKNRLLVAKV